MKTQKFDNFTWMWSEAKIFLLSGGDLTRNAWYTHTVYVKILKAYICIYII